MNKSNKLPLVPNVLVPPTPLRRKAKDYLMDIHKDDQVMFGPYLSKSDFRVLHLTSDYVVLDDRRDGAPPCKVHKSFIKAVFHNGKLVYLKNGLTEKDLVNEDQEVMIPVVDFIKSITDESVVSEVVENDNQ